MQQPKPCIVCGHASRFLSLTFNEWVCSDQCLDALQDLAVYDEREYNASA